MKEVQVKVSYTEKEKYPGKLANYTLKEDYLQIEGDKGHLLRIYFVSDHILRFRYANEGYFDADFSYAIAPDFVYEKVAVEVDETADDLIVHTPSVDCFVSKERLSIKICDKQGNVINEDEKGYHWERNTEYDGYIVKNSKKAHPTEAFYGLGDKPTDLNLDGKRFKNWGTDEYGYHRDTDPLYKSIPIYYGLHEHGAYGIFFDNTFEAYFDFQKERNDVVSFWAQGGEMNYYFIAGPEIMDVCQRYTQFTGTPEMPPMS